MSPSGRALRKGVVSGVMGIADTACSVAPMRANRWKDHPEGVDHEQSERRSR